MKQFRLPSTVQLANQTRGTLKDVKEESLEWFHESPEFKSWISTDNSTYLWLYGLPGDGKTVIAMYTKQILSKSQGYSRERDVASIFCSRKDTEIGIAFSLASQLICRINRAIAMQHKVVLPEFRKEHFEEADVTRDIWELLEALIRLLPWHEVIFILDGIDEIGLKIRSQFLQSLHYLEKRTQGKAIMRILVSSRDYPDIRDSLGHYSTIARGKELKGKEPLIWRCESIDQANQSVLKPSILKSGMREKAK